MNQENTQKLIEKHPELFADVELIECGDGWFDLTDNLATKLSEWPEIRAVRVKEKFGGLRFYFDGGPEQAYRLVREAETLSMTICDVCGATGSLVDVTRFWVATRCARHAKVLQSGVEL